MTPVPNLQRHWGRGVLFGMLVLTAFQFSLCCLAQNRPNPVALLEGVEDARLKIPASRLTLRSLYKDVRVTKERDYLVEFDQDRRRFTVVKGGNKVRTCFNGSEVYCYDGVDMFTIRDLKDQVGEPLYDPRLLGITTTYHWSERLATLIPYKGILKIETVGREKINDKDTWHVRVDDVPNGHIDLWIDDKNGFRVYQYHDTIEGVRKYTTVSSYSDGDYFWLPTRVETKNYDGKGVLQFESLVSVLKAETKVQFPEKTWSLGGMEPPSGITITDARIHKPLGFWNGTSVGPSPSVPPPAPSLETREPNASGKSSRPQIYDENADGTKQIDNALALAKREKKLVLLHFGANWCSWCKKLHHLFQSDAKIAARLKHDYIVVLIDVNAGHNEEVDKRYGHPTRFGLPVIVILDAEGKPLATQDTSKLEEGDRHAPQKVLQFLEAWAVQ